MLSTLRQCNRFVAIAVGLMFLCCAGLVLIDIILRRLGSSLGGTDEIAGYVMAIGTAWGMAAAMLELTHVRIDFLRTLAKEKIRVLFDLVALFALSCTVSIIAVQCWPVVSTTLKNSSRANTPLETPLAWVQIPWFAGWVWFSFMAWLILVSAALLVLKGKFAETERAIGIFPTHDKNS